MFNFEITTKSLRTELLSFCSVVTIYVAAYMCVSKRINIREKTTKHGNKFSTFHKSVTDGRPSKSYVTLMSACNVMMSNTPRT